MGEITVDITPVGMKTPEGVARVNKAMQDCDNRRADVANKTHELLRHHFYMLLETLNKNSEFEAAEDLADIKEACEKMIDAQNEFMKALAGR